MKYLILDTNVFVQDFRMEGNAFDALLSNYSAVADKILIPNIVYQETLNKYAERTADAITSYKKACKKLHTLVGPEVEEPEIEDVEILTDAYKRHIDSQLDSVQHEIVDYPDVSHEHIAQKAIKRQKPFKKSGEGYRDTIIWETILETLRNDSECEIIFVSNNTSDFWAGENLADELIEELSKNGISPQRVEIYKTVKDVVDVLLLSHLQTLALLKDQINNGSVPGFDLEDWIADQLFNLIDPYDVGNLIAGIDEDEATVELSEVYEVSSIQANEVKVLSGNKQYLLISAKIGLGVEVCADWGQYEDSDAIEKIFNERGMGIPTPYDCAYVSGDAQVDMSVIIQGEDFQNAKLEVLSLW
jgi:predicted nucleic acid-binding protein